jgi:RNA polymerase sigma-70 factor (ECF subfamily)
METKILTSPLFDEKYLQALAARNEDAENYLIAHFSRPVRLSLCARLRSAELIEDGYQETFLRVLAYFRSGKTLGNPVSLPSFVHTTCRNTALELLRRETRHDQLPGNAPEPSDSAPNPEGQMVTEERKGIVRQLLKDLPEKDRELLRRVFLEDEDKDSICAEFQIDRAHLRVLLHRACLRFKTTILQWSRGEGARSAAGVRSRRQYGRAFAHRYQPF